MMAPVPTRNPAMYAMVIVMRLLQGILVLVSVASSENRYPQRYPQERWRGQDGKLSLLIAVPLSDG